MTTTVSLSDGQVEKGIRLLTKEQVAQRLQLSTRTVYRKWQDGEMPAPVKLGKHVVRWRSDVIDAWIADDCPRVGR